MLNLDTHILLFALTDQLTPTEKKVLSNYPWSISAIVVWEITKLSQLKRIDIDIHDIEFVRTLNKIHQWPLDLDVCQSIKKLDFRSDPADEIIAATSLFHQIPLITRDKHILGSKVVPFLNIEA